MTLPSNKAIMAPLPGNGVTKDFDFDFVCWDDDELEVWYKNAAGTSTLLTSNYTVSLNADQDANPGGTVNYPTTGSAISSSEYIIPKRAMPFTQTTLDVTNGQAFDAEVAELAIDRAAAERQEILETIDRSIVVDPGQDIDNYLGDCQTAQTAAESAQTAAETAETNAETAETNAAASASAAAASAASLVLHDEDDMTSDDDEAGSTQQAIKAYADHLIDSVQTADYTILTSGINTLLTLGASTTANRTFTLPSVGSSDDGMVVHFLNESAYHLTLSPSDDDMIWVSGAGYGVELFPGAGCTLRYQHDTENWQIISSTGRIYPEGLRMWFDMSKPFMSVGIHRLYDRTMQFEATLRNDAVLSIGSDYNPTLPFLQFDGTGDYANINRYEKNLFAPFNSLTEDWTLFLRVRPTVTGVLETYFSQDDLSGTLWEIRKTSSDEASIRWRISGVNQIALSSTTTMSAGVWYNIAVVVNQGVVGLYIGNADNAAEMNQEEYDASWSTADVATDYVLGNLESASQYAQCRISSIVVAKQNLFNATPVSGLADSFQLPQFLQFIKGS